MALVRTKDTSPELVVRRILHAWGFRYRLHRKDLPGRPDIVLPRHRLIIDVRGCFWHSCPDCDRGRRRPKSNVEFWSRKLSANVERDLRNTKALEERGWRVEIVWECQTKNTASLKVRLLGVLTTIRPTLSRKASEATRLPRLVAS